MPERCAECGSYFYSFEDKICRACFEDLKRENEELQEKISDLEAEVATLEDEITELQEEIAKLLEYRDIVMEDPKLWSKLIAKRIKPHSE